MMRPGFAPLQESTSQFRTPPFMLRCGMKGDDPGLAGLVRQVGRYRVGAVLALVGLLASLNYVVRLGKPHHPIWDESYYITTTARYEAGRAQFASHPPLGLMLIAAGDALLRPNRGLDTSGIGRDKKIAGEQLPRHYSFVGIRAASGAFAVAGALVFCALMLVLTRSAAAALLLSNLYVFENAFIVHFRAAHLDAFQLFFCLCAVLCVALSVRRGHQGSRGLDFLLGLSCALAMMVKLNAAVLALLAVMLLVWRASCNWRRERSARTIALAARDGSVMVAGALLAIALVFTLHTALGRRPPDPTSAAGARDLRFVSVTYRDYLRGERALSPQVVFAATRDYASFVFTDFADMARSDENASQALMWPLHRKTINYRWDSREEETRYVQLCGNLFSWSLALVAPLAAAALLLLNAVRPVGAGEPGVRVLLALLLLEYLAFMGLHAWLGTQRVMYLYHYFIGLLLAFCMVPLVWLEAAQRWPGLRARLVPLAAGGTAALLASFVFYAPLTFHRPLTYAQCQRRNFLQHVVDCQP